MGDWKKAVDFVFLGCLRPLKLVELVGEMLALCTKPTKESTKSLLFPLKGHQTSKLETGFFWTQKNKSFTKNHDWLVPEFLHNITTKPAKMFLDTNLATST